MANGSDGYEFQRLHGMGENLHDVVIESSGTRCRIYAPVGAHRDLLAYLVRRLLENGANSSFVNQIVDEDVPASEVARDPFDMIDLDNNDMAKKRRIEEKKEGEKRKSEEPNQEKMKIVRSEGESQGQVNKEMDVDTIMDSEWERIKDELRQEKIPLLMIEGSSMDKAIQAARIQDMMGE